MWLLANVKLWLYFGAVTVVFLSGMYVRGQWDESRLQSKLETQQKALVAECEKNKQITSEVSKSYEDKISALNKRLSTIRMRPSACVPVANTSGTNNAGTSRKLSGQDGINSDIFYDYAGDAEKTRLQLISCQDFIRLERK